MFTKLDEDAIREYQLYCRQVHETDVVSRIRAALAAMGPRDLIDPEKDSELWERVRRNVETRRPFSLIRLGDGEGNVLFWGARRNRFPALARKCMLAIWKNMFGGHAYTDEAWSMLFDSKIKAIANSDYLGIPLLEDIEWGLREGARQDDIERLDVRGAGGYLAIWDYLAEQLGTGVCESKTVTHRFIHTWSSGHVARLIQSAGNVSLVSCHPELLDKLKELTGMRQGHCYLIPPQASNIGTTPSKPHFPSHFETLNGELAERNFSGQLFFVGAGLLGKLYCNRIKLQGGMAIDVGSMMDVWMGKGVRHYQTAEFIRDNLAALGNASAQAYPANQSRLEG